MRKPPLNGRELLEKWIVPTPKNQREWDYIEGEWRAHKQSVQSLLETISPAKEARPAMDEVLRQSEALRRAIENLPYGIRIKLPTHLDENRPRITASCPGAGTRIVDELAFLECQIHLWRDSYPSDGHPIEYTKRACFVSCHGFLSRSRKGREIKKTGPVAALAQSVWFELKGEWTELNTWENFGKSMRKECLSRGEPDPFL